MARNKWNTIEHALSDEAISRLPSEQNIGIWLMQKREELEPERCSAILRSLSSVQYITNLNHSELQELRTRLGAFQSSISKLYNNSHSHGGKS